VLWVSYQKQKEAADKDNSTVTKVGNQRERKHDDDGVE
jgi:hypothetical protein